MSITLLVWDVIQDPDLPPPHRPPQRRGARPLTLALEVMLVPAFLPRRMRRAVFVLA